MSERNVCDGFEPARISADCNRGACWGIRRTADGAALPWVFATEEEAAAFIERHECNPGVLPRAVATTEGPNRSGNAAG